MRYELFKFEEQQHNIEELKVFDDDVTEDEIAEEYEDWLNNLVCDRAKRISCDENGKPL